MITTIKIATINSSNMIVDINDIIARPTDKKRTECLKLRHCPRWPNHSSCFNVVYKNSISISIGALKGLRTNVFIQ